MTVEGDEIEALGRATSASLAGAAPGLLSAYGGAARESFLWLRHFNVVSAGASGRDLLRGSHAALVETAALLSLGLARAALGSIRQQAELLLAFSYFQNHAEEWERVCATGDGFMLPGTIIKYHLEADKRLKSRLDILKTRGEPDLRDVYRFLSAHVHGQSSLTVPVGEHLSSACLDREIMVQVSDAQLLTSRALGNYFVAVHASRWPDIPSESVARVSAALDPKQRPRFFQDDPTCSP